MFLAGASMPPSVKQCCGYIPLNYGREVKRTVTLAEITRSLIMSNSLLQTEVAYCTKLQAMICAMFLEWSKTTYIQYVIHHIKKAA
jgi:hypothetical protein